MKCCCSESTPFCWQPKLLIWVAQDNPPTLQIFLLDGCHVPNRLSSQGCFSWESAAKQTTTDLASLNWLSTQHKSWQISTLQLLTWKLHLSAYQSAFPALLPQGFVSDPTVGKATHCKWTLPHIHKGMARIQKKQKEGTWALKCVKVASEIGLASISMQLWYPFLMQPGRSKENHKR